MSRFSVALSLATALLLGVPAIAPKTAVAFEWLGHINEDAKGLDSDDPQTRLAAVRALARYDIEWTREYLLAALDDDDVHVRTAAGRALATHHEERALPMLIKWLALPDSQSKQVGASILGDMKAQAAVPALVRALGDSDPLVRSASLIALGTIGGEAVVIPLVTLLEDDKADVRIVAIQQLQAVEDTRAVIPLVGLFRNSSQRVRIAAITAVGSLRDDSASDALIRELSDPAEPVRLAAIAALGDLRAPRATDTLMNLMATGSTALRSKAAFSLAQIAKSHPTEDRSEEAVALLVETLAESRLRNAAMEALRTAGPIAVPHLIAHLDGERQGDPVSAVKLLEELGDSQATPALVRELSRGRIPQATTLSALSRVGDSRALLPILSLLDDPSPAVRLGAMRSLEPLLGEPSAAADLLAERLGDPEPEIRLIATKYLGQMKARSAVPALLAIAETKGDFALRATAFQALGAIGDARATPLALATLKSDNASLRAVAADVLSELADPKAVAPLLAIAKDKSHVARTFAIEALGSSLRGKEHKKAVGVFLKLANGPELRPALAAIEALSGVRDPRTAPALQRHLVGTDPERKRAAAQVLGELKVAASAEALRVALREDGQRIGAAAAWSLGDLGTLSIAPDLLEASERKGSARAVNASAALARIATPAMGKHLVTLLLHANPLVRVNAIAGLARLGDATQTPALESILASDSSWLVRVASVRALSMLGSSNKALEKASKEDFRNEVREAATAVLKAPFAPAAESRWAVFRIVDPLRDDRPVSQEARFFVGADGIARVGFSDLRGRIYSQKFPEGPYVQGPLSSLGGF